MFNFSPLEWKSGVKLDGDVEKLKPSELSELTQITIISFVFAKIRFHLAKIRILF